jgi:hypothetical protein
MDAYTFGLAKVASAAGLLDLNMVSDSKQASAAIRGAGGAVGDLFDAPSIQKEVNARVPLDGLFGAHTVMGGLKRLSDPYATAREIGDMIPGVEPMDYALRRSMGGGPGEWLSDIWNAPSNLRRLDDDFISRKRQEPSSYGFGAERTLNEQGNRYNVDLHHPSFREASELSGITDNFQNNAVHFELLRALETEGRARRGVQGAIIGGAGTAGLGAAGATAYGMGDADTTGNKIRQAANKNLGTDFKTQSRFSNAFGG